MKPSTLFRLLSLVALLCAASLLAARPQTAAARAYTLTISTTGHGSVKHSPPLAGYEAGQEVTLTATADPGWRFVEWRGNFAPPADWWNALWAYRLPLTVSAGPYARSDKPAEAELNFTELLQALGADGALDVNSLRVVEVDGANAVIDSNVPFQFDAAGDFNAGSNARGALIWLLTGETAANATRTYHVYFDTVGDNFSPPTVPPLVSVKNNVNDEGQASFQIDTRNASYFFQRQGGALSSLVDVNGNDWIGYHPEGGPAGNYRGIPNFTPDYFHPGATTATSTLVNQGPLKATVRAVTPNNWKVQWAFYPTYATMTVLSIDEPYWFLYEGTPGGALEIDSDIVVRANGTQILASGSWSGDLPAPEWLYFGDPAVGRSLFLVHHEDDNGSDSYYQMQKQMTVFGFGREKLNRYLTAVPQTFTIGLMDETAHNKAKNVVNGAYQPLAVTAGAPEKKERLATDSANPLTITITDDTEITAVFEQEQYALNVTTSGEGQVKVAPAQDSYLYGDTVTLTPEPALGWLFAGWGGALSGTETPKTLTITGDTTVAAAFIVEPEVTLTVQVIGNGGVTQAPEQPRYNDVVTLTATAAPGWHFAGWGGDLNGVVNPAEIIMDGSKTITATFVEDTVPTVTLTVTVVGDGTVTRNPDRPLKRGETVTLTATAEPGWRFLGWSGDLTGDTNPVQLTMRGNKSVTATFVEDSEPTYMLTVTTVGNGTVMRDPDRPLRLGETVTLTATAASGWTFSGWSGALSGTQNPATLTISDDLTVEATFTPVERFTVYLPFVQR